MMNPQINMLRAAVAAAFCGAAAAAGAANVDVYGVVDTGLVYQHASSYSAVVSGEPVASPSSDTFAMKSGVVSGSRFGLKGSEDLGDGVTVGFVLENGFSGDTGAFADDDRLFNREAQLYVTGAAGTLSFGRVGNLNSGNGTFGLTGAMSPFGTTWGEYSAAPNNVMSGFDRYDNTVTFKTPSFGGLNLYFQYSMNTDATYKDGMDNKSSADRYYALGLTINNGPFALAAVIDRTNYSSTKWPSATPDWNTASDMEDAFTFTLGGSYDFDVVKAYAGVQYFNHVELSSIDRVPADSFDLDANGTKYQAQGYGLSLGADVPVCGGVLKVATAYMDATVDTVNNYALADGNLGEIDLKRWNTSVGYQYSFSKRTSVYGVASYSYNNVQADKVGLDIDANVTEIAVGLVHKF